jgi:hypothetical protein
LTLSPPFTDFFAAVLRFLDLASDGLLTVRPCRCSYFPFSSVFSLRVSALLLPLIHSYRSSTLLRPSRFDSVDPICGASLASLSGDPIAFLFTRSSGNATKVGAEGEPVFGDGH